jgi:hypothetical protein
MSPRSWRHLEKGVLERAGGAEGDGGSAAPEWIPQHMVRIIKLPNTDLLLKKTNAPSRISSEIIAALLAGIVAASGCGSALEIVERTAALSTIALPLILFP